MLLRNNHRNPLLQYMMKILPLLMLVVFSTGSAAQENTPRPVKVGVYVRA